MLVETDFQYITKVVNSCQNELQLKTTKNLFETFKRKWCKQINKMDMINYLYRFDSAYQLKRIRL